MLQSDQELRVVSDQDLKLDLRAVPPSIEERQGGYYIAQSPITFGAAILRFKEGLSPELIHRDCYPSLPLAKIYSAISYYLNNQELVDNYLKQLQQYENELQEHLLARHPEFIKPAEELRARAGTRPQE